MLNKGKKIIIPPINAMGKKKERMYFQDPPLLIGGCGRSGTTLLLSMLSAHPAIFAFPDELSIFNHWETAHTGNKLPLRMDRMYRYLLTHRIPVTTKFWCEKTPANIKHIPEIMEYFNKQVRFIHIIRDGRDVCLSKHPDKPDSYWVSPERWVEDVRAGLEFREQPQMLTIFYENLVQYYRETMKSILDFLDEPYVEEMNQWNKNTTVKRNNAWYGPVENLHDQSVGKWKKTENQERIRELMNYDDFKLLLKELKYI